MVIVKKKITTDESKTNKSQYTYKKCSYKVVR